MIVAVQKARRNWESAPDAWSIANLLTTMTMIEVIVILAIFSALGYTLGPDDDDLIDIERD